MAILQRTFILIEVQLIVPIGRKEKRKTSRKALDTKILAYFCANPNLPGPRFFIQGSNKMKTIKNHLGRALPCINPATPQDDLTAKLDSDQKQKFLGALEEIIEDVAKKLGRKHFANSFSMK